SWSPARSKISSWAPASRSASAASTNSRAFLTLGASLPRRSDTRDRTVGLTSVRCPQPSRQAARRFPGLEQAEGPGRGRLEHHGLLRPRISDARRVHADSEFHWADRPSFRRDHLMRMRPRNVAILSGSSDRIVTFGKERFKKLYRMSAEW